MPTPQLIHVQYEDGGLRRVTTHAAVDEIVATGDVSEVSLQFGPRPLPTDEAGRRAAAELTAAAIATVCAAGSLPEPELALPRIGTRAEAMVGGKPGPACKYGVGVVSNLAWCAVLRTWQVGVVFDEPAGTHYGNPIGGATVFPCQVHVIGGPGRPFSSMTPDEIVALRDQQRLAGWTGPNVLG